jgi:hypothetical protein
MSTLSGPGAGGDPIGVPVTRSDAPWTEKVRVIGGLVAVSLGLLAVVGLAIGALVAGGQTAATVAGSASGVVGSIVGAYFGVKVGADQTREAIGAAREASAQKDAHAAKAQVYALHVAPGDAAAIEAEAQQAAERATAL